MASVAPPSPTPVQHCGAKRSRHAELELHCSPISKRYRFQSAQGQASPNNRRVAAFLHLVAVFPLMDEKVIAAVLDSCQNDLDDALAKLTELSLSPTRSVAPDLSQLEAAGQGSRKEAVDLRADGSDAAASPQQSPHGADAQADAQETELQHWTAALCNDLASASSKADVQQRVYGFLSQCKRHVEAQQELKQESRAAELLQRNTVLKKAVAIQHTRLTRVNAEKDMQIQQLQGALAECQSRCQSLEAANYALTLHLKQATSGNQFAPGPPDVC